MMSSGFLTSEVGDIDMSLDRARGAKSIASVNQENGISWVFFGFNFRCNYSFRRQRFLDTVINTDTFYMLLSEV